MHEELPEEFVAIAPEWRRVRPLWLVATLSAATFGLYSFFWLFTTWRELKQERADPNMHPFWHVMTQFVPIYGYYRFHAHLRTINEVAESGKSTLRLTPSYLLTGWVVSSAISNYSIRASFRGEDIPFIFDLIAIAISAVVLLMAQRGLNAAWLNLPGGTPSSHTHWFEWVLIVLGALIWVLAGVALILPEE